MACGSVTARELEAALAAQHAQAEAPRVGELLVDQAGVPAQVVNAALGKQKAAEERRASETRNVKVPADKLDALIDQVGELVIAGAATQLQASRPAAARCRRPPPTCCASSRTFATPRCACA